jgi:predicted nucleic acid-binding protein
MVVVDTSVWIEVLRDRAGMKRRALAKAIAEDDVALTRFNQLELLQGCAGEQEWGLLKPYLDAQEYIEMGRESWASAARMYFELRQRGKTVRSPIDCCIAQVAIDHDTLLLHRDRDFETIAEIRPLRQMWLAW